LHVLQDKESTVKLNYSVVIREWMDDLAQVLAQPKTTENRLLADYITQVLEEWEKKQPAAYAKARFAR
jgi:hypothetical protein